MSAGLRRVRLRATGLGPSSLRATAMEITSKVIQTTIIQTWSRDLRPENVSTHLPGLPYETARPLPLGSDRRTGNGASWFEIVATRNSAGRYREIPSANPFPPNAASVRTALVCPAFYTAGAIPKRDFAILNKCSPKGKRFLLISSLFWDR